MLPEIYKKIFSSHKKFKLIFENLLEKREEQIIIDGSLKITEDFGNLLIALYKSNLIDSLMEKFLCHLQHKLSKENSGKICVLLKIFDQISLIMEKRNLGEFLTLMDFVYSMANLNDPKFIKCSKKAQMMIDNFNSRLPFNDIEKVNPSFLHAIKVVALGKELTFKINVMNANECAKFYVDRIFVDSKIFWCLKSFKFDQKADEENFIPEIIKILMEMFRDQHEDQKGELTPQKSSKTLTFLFLLFRQEILSDENYIKCAEILFNSISSGCTSLNVDCLWTLVMPFRGTEILKKYFGKIRFSMIYELLMSNLYLIKWQGSLPEIGTIPEPKEFCYLKLEEIPTENLQNCAFLMVNNIANLNDISDEIVGDFLDLEKRFELVVKRSYFDLNLRQYFHLEIRHKIAYIYALPYIQNVKWNELKNILKFLAYRLNKLQNCEKSLLVEEFELIYSILTLRTDECADSQDFAELILEFSKNVNETFLPYFAGVFDNF